MDPVLGGALLGAMLLALADRILSILYPFVLNRRNRWKLRRPILFGVLCVVAAFVLEIGLLFLARKLEWGVSFFLLPFHSTLVVAALTHALALAWPRVEPTLAELVARPPNRAA